MSELGKRVVVAMIAIPIVLGLVYLGGWFVGAPLALFAGLGAMEVGRFGEEKGVRSVSWVSIPGAAVLVLGASWQATFVAWAPWALGLFALLAPLSLCLVMFERGPDGAPLGAVGSTLFAVAYVGLGLSFGPLLIAFPEAVGWTDAGGAALAGLAAIALPLAATWVGDAAAYFVGSAIGKRRLAESISPKKSWEGFWAGILGAAGAAVLWGAVAGGVLPQASLSPLALAGVGAALGLAAVLGDLVESLLKREAGVKDSGAFFPGHGGVLDRTDSLLFTLPLAYVLLSALARLG